MPDAFLVGFGSRRGPMPAWQLAADAVREGVASAGLQVADVDRLVLSSAMPSTPEELSLGTVVADALRIAPSAGAFGVAFGEASGLLAIAQAAEAIWTGAARVAVGGGADTPSRMPYWVPGLRIGAAVDPAVVIDPLPAASFNLATVRDVDGGDRVAQDAFAQRSRERARETGQPGRSPHPSESLEALKPIHSADGSITAGNSAAPADGAAAAILAEGGGEASVAGWSLVADRGGAPAALAAAIRSATGALEPRDLIAIEVHESSAALCLATASLLGVDPEVLNRLGGEIATGSAGAACGALMVERACMQLAVADPPARAVGAAAGPGGQAIAIAIDRRRQ